MPGQVAADDDVDMDTPPEQKLSPPQSGSEESAEVLEVEENTAEARAEAEEVNSDLMNDESGQNTPDHSGEDTGTDKDEEESPQRGSNLKIFEQPPPFRPSTIRVSKEFSQLKEIISESSDEAVQAVLREHWKKFLFGEEDARQAIIDDHLSFILRTGLANASGDVLELFAASASKSQRFAELALANATSDQVDAYVPTEILEPILRDRLKSVPAMQLIQWLAEAERLGYSADDIMENGDESLVMPNLPRGKFASYSEETEDDEVDAPPRSNHIPRERHQQLPQAQIVPQEYPPPSETHYQPHNGTRQVGRHRVPLPATPQSVGHSHPNLNGTSSTCPNCRRILPTSVGFNFHVAKKVCSKATPPGGWKGICKNCGQGFTTKQGLDYHDMKNVCYASTVPPSAPPSSTGASTYEASNPQIHRPPYNQAASIPSPAYTTPPIAPQARAHPTARPAFNSARNPADAAVSTLSTPRFISETPSRAGSQGSSGGPRRQAYADSPETRVAPDALPPAKLAELNKRLADIDSKYEKDCAAVRHDPNLSELTKQQKLTSLKNGAASRKSQTRKSFGVTLRLRDKDKKFMKQQGLQSGYNKTPGSAAMNHYIDPRYEHSVRASQGEAYPSPDMPKPLAQLATPPPAAATGGFTPLNRPGAPAEVAAFASALAQRIRQGSSDQMIRNGQGVKRQRRDSQDNSGDVAVMVISSDEEGRSAS